MNIQTSEEKKIRQEASDWITILTSPDTASDTKEKFTQWCKADPRHEEVYARISGTFSLMGHIEDQDLLKLADPNYSDGSIFQRLADWLKPTPAPARPVMAFGLAMALIITLAINVNLFDNTSDQTFATQTAEIRDIVLADGSIVTLGARSHIEVSFSEDERRVNLMNGEAFFAVAKDMGRPFYVQSNGVEIKVVGTRFNVHKGPNGLRIAVEEGVVNVSNEPPKISEDIPDTPLVTHPAGKESATGIAVPPSEDTSLDFTTKAVLTAGEYVIYQQGSLSKVKVSETTSQPSAWRDGRLVYVDASFAELIADIGRYYDGEIRLTSKEVGAIRISGVFWTSKINDLIETLPEYLPVNVQYQGDHIVIIGLNQDQS